MDDVIEYVREWNLESSKNGLERYMKEHDEELKEETKTRNSLDIAKNMLKDNTPISNIVKYTGLTRKQVLSLK